MGNRVWHQAFSALLCSALFLFVGNSQAASLGKVEVASHLGEPFFAEVPLKLEANELASKVFVEIAAPADYKIFEVYRDPVLKAIRADVASDARGARVKLSSRSRIKSPFFNLVLKIRYGRVSHFKKFPVFLDVPNAVQQAAQKAPQPAVEAVQQPLAVARSSLTESAGQAFAPTVVQIVADEQKKTKYYQGWARTDRYGPIVRGDSLSIVAERLRVDHRYTLNQTMLALFEKNRADFGQDNMNLMKAGSFLAVPSAAEIEQYSKLEAARVLAEHEKAWKKLTRQPRYAAEAKAQRTRYTKRISIGEHADGVAAAPVAAIAVAADATVVNKQQDQPTDKATDQSADELAAATEAPASATAQAGADATEKAVTTASTKATVDQTLQEQTSQTLIRLQEQNEVLKQQLIGTQKSIEDLSRKVAQNQAATTEKVHIKKLEVMIVGLQSELKKMHQQQPTPVVAGMNWMMWLLMALVVLLLGVVAKLMRREPAHPATPADLMLETPDTDSEQAAGQHAVQGDSLTSVIENEVAGIETGETPVPVGKETATIDSLPAFTDELSDTDTAELEPFDADAEAEPDPDIDYVSEADTYIRYGMNDEALKQLDMALRLQPDHVQAHIKKAELLLGKNDQEGLDATIAAATMTLTAVDLGRFKSFIEGLGEYVARIDVEAQKKQQGEDVEAIDSNKTLSLEPSAVDDLDFDFAGLDGIAEAVTTAEMTGELELPELDRESPADETLRSDGADQESDDMPWLHDEMIDAAADDSEAGATLHLDQLLSEFDDKDGPLDAVRTVDGLDEAFFEPAASESPDKLDEMGVDTDHGATQELDHLLSEFANEEDGLLEIDPDFSDLNDVNPADTSIAAEDSLEDSDNAEGATQVLGRLLDEFTDDEADDEEDPHKKG